MDTVHICCTLLKQYCKFFYHMLAQTISFVKGFILTSYIISYIVLLRSLKLRTNNSIGLDFVYFTSQPYFSQRMVTTSCIYK